jgi:RNA polymerase sigma factor (sigma-70 family)
MDYNKIEEIVSLAKAGNKQAKEDIAMEFRPFILNLSKKTHIISYEFSDIENECYRVLFKCVNKYDIERHRFVAYATNAIKNSISGLIRVTARRGGNYGQKPFTYSNCTNNAPFPCGDSVDDFIVNKLNRKKLKYAIKDLDYIEQELLYYIYIKGYSLNKYSKIKGISYYAASSVRESMIDKLRVDFRF